MFFLHDGDIIPGEGIGILKLGMTLDQIRKIVGKCVTRDLDDTWRINAGDVQYG